MQGVHPPLDEELLSLHCRCDVWNGGSRGRWGARLKMVGCAVQVVCVGICVWFVGCVRWMCDVYARVSKCLYL